MKKLYQALDIQSKHYLTVIKYLNDAGGQVRLVGGVVRDTLLGLPVKDIDMATDFTPAQVTSVLESHGVKIIPTGINFGTVSAFINKEVFEITTLRKDLLCDGRRASVEYSKDFREDAARRDFTINALSYCPIKHEIYDYFSGIDDLNNRKVIFIGTADERIKEDYLRILRFFRFSCKYANKIDDEALEACVRFKAQLKLLSGERIKSEMDNILSLERSPYILETMYDSGIVQVIFPVTKYDQALHLKAIKVTQLFNTHVDLTVIYALLFDISLKELLKLKFSRASAIRVIKLLQLKESLGEKSLPLLLKTIWLEDKSFVCYFVFASTLLEDNKIVYDLFVSLKNNSIPNFPLDGNDLIKLGYVGENLGKLIKNLKHKWIESDFTLNKEQMINMVKNNEI
jgi:poly(A) polymerase